MRQDEDFAGHSVIAEYFSEIPEKK